MATEPAIPAWRVARPWLALAAAATVFAVLLPTLPMGTQARVAAGDLLQLAAAGVGALLCLGRGRREEGRHRKGWVLLAAAAGSWGLGQAVWTWYEVGLQVAPPLPGLHDLFYLLTYPLAAAGLLALSPFTRHGGVFSVSLVLDGIISAVAAYVVTWPFLLDPAFDAIGDPLEAYVTVAYPLADLVLLSVTGGILFRSKAVRRSGLALAYAAFWGLLIADFAWATGILHGSYVTGDAADAGWVFAFLVLAASARSPLAAPTTPSVGYARGVGQVLPVVAIALAVVSFLRMEITTRHADLVWLAATTLLVLLAFLRQVLAFLESRALQREHDALKSRYSEIVEGAPTGVFRATMDGRIVLANKAFATMAGFPTAQALQAAAASGVRLYSDPADQHRLRTLLAKGARADNFEFRIVRPDGTPRTLVLDGGPRTSAEGTFLEGFVRDVSVERGLAGDLERTRRTLRVISLCNQALVRATDEHSLLKEVCALLVGPGGYRLAWVGEAKRVSGKPVRPLAWAGEGSDYVQTADITWADQDPRGLGPTGRAIRDGRPYVVQDIRSHPDMGPWYDQVVRQGFAASCALPLDLDPERGALMVYTDDAHAFGPDELAMLEELAADVGFGVRTLRSRRAAAAVDRARRELAATYAAILESTTNGVFRTTLDGRLTFASDAGASLLGYGSPADLQAGVKSMADLYVDAGARDEFIALVREGSRRPFETRFRRKDGSVVWVRLRARIMRTAEGDEELVGTVEDITADKQAAEAHDRLVARDRDVQRLEQLNKMRMDFLNTAAHDLKTPLTPLKLQMATLRLKGHIAPEHRGALDLMERNLRRFESLIEDMLDAARLQSGKLALHREPVELAPLVQETVVSFQEASRQKGLQVLVSAKPGVVIDADPTKCMQVLMNLVSNAVKYTQTGGHLRITTAVDGDRAVVDVQDDGYGLTADQIGKLFQPFVRLHEAVPGSAGGTGLGLYISRGIAEWHGGRLWVDSDGPGKGSVFHLAWPLAKTVQVPDAAAAANAPGKT